MLPKIIVADISERNDLCILIGLEEKKMMSYEGEGSKVEDLRRWILNSLDIVRRNKKLQIVVWDADRLSVECQAILLKPLEELGEDIKLYLIVKSENKMLPTIISRCEVQYLGEGIKESSIYWNEVRKCFASGPAACIAFSDSLDKEQAKSMVKEVIVKLKNSLEVEINRKRLKVIENALICLADLEGTNVNQKLTVDNFLISSWKLIKA